MVTTVRIEETELKEFNVLKDEIQRNIFEFGELYLEKMEVDNLYKRLALKETELRNKTEEFKKRENELMDKVFKKYGEGSLDIKNGIFIPSEKPQ